MKVIVAGFSKTGTKTLNAALSILGYKVYDVLENFWYLGDYWHKIFDGKGSIDDFKDMYEDVDAVTDVPANMFWEEIHEAFPDSQIILTTRDEDSWFRSAQQQLTVMRDNRMLLAVQYLTKTGRELFRLMQKMQCVLFGVNRRSPGDYPLPNPLLSKRRYRQHQQYCLQNAPKDKLLVFNVADGWEPLCKFLGKEIPEQPFPRKNVGGTIVEEQFTTGPVALRLKKEMTTNIQILIGVVVVLCAMILTYLFYN